jgi:uncharacterized iron-regulated membrane protein
MRTGLVGTAAIYVALAAGVFMLGAGVFTWWQSRSHAEALPPAHAVVESAEAAPPALATAADVPAEPARVDPVKRRSAAPAALNCTDLRALFGLGESLTKEQKDYLQQHC